MTRKPKGVIRGGYGFLINREQNTVDITNLKTFKTMSVVKPPTLINFYDLKLFAAGFAVAKDPGWATVI